MNARKLYRELPCLVTDEDGVRCARRPTCFAHYPTHRGMGAGKAGWHYREGVPLCDHHHRLLDRRAGTRREQDRIGELVARNAPRFWEALDRVFRPELFEADVRLPRFAPRDWMVPDQVDFVWAFDEDGEGAACVTVEVETAPPAGNRGEVPEGPAPQGVGRRDSEDGIGGGELLDGVDERRDSR